MRRARRRPAPPRLHRLADRRARPDARRHRRPPRPPRRHLPAARPGPGRRRRPAGRRVPAGAAQRAGDGRAAPAPPRAGTARGAAAGAAVEERAARPQPAQPADQLHRALRAGPGRARPGARRAGELRPRRDADHPAAGRPAGRRPEGARRRRPPASCPRSSSTELLVDRREVHADVTTGGYLPRLRGARLQGADGASRRPAPTTSTWRSAGWCGSSTAGRCARRWCSSRSPSRRWAAPAPTG